MYERLGRTEDLHGQWLELASDHRSAGHSIAATSWALRALGRTDDAIRQLRDDVLPVARSVPEVRDELLPNLLTTLADWLETRDQGADRRRARDLRREAADLTGRDNS